RNRGRSRLGGVEEQSKGIRRRRHQEERLAGRIDCESGCEEGQRGEEKQNRSPHHRLLRRRKKKLLGRDEHDEGLKPDPARIGHKSPMPHVIHPMLATLVDKPFDSQDWLYEVKWDGYRAITFLDRGSVRLVSRNQNDMTAAYPELRAIADAVKARTAILD